MEISAITSTTGTPVAPGDCKRVADDAGVHGDRPSIQRQKEPTPPPGLIGSNVLVEFNRHAGTGAEVVKFVDKQTGELLSQTPAQQVLDAVTNLMNMVNRRED